MINVAVAGVGAWGRNVVRDFYQIKKANLIYCYDKSDVSLDLVRQSYPGVKVTSEYEKILNDKNIDAVIIVTPTPTHFELAKKALEADKHILVEKSLTLKAQEAKILVTLAGKKKRKIMVGHLLKYHPAILEMKKRIERGELGDICYFQAQRLNFGRIRTTENVMWDLATHDIYVAIYLLGKYPQEVSAFGKTLIDKKKKIKDVVFLSLFFNDGVFAHIQASWFDVEKVRKMRVIGKEKMMIFDELNPSCKLKIYEQAVAVKENANSNASFSLKEGKMVIPQVEDKQPLREECLHFIECVEKDKVPFTDGEEGFKVVKVLEAAQKSLECGRSIKTYL